MNNIKLKIWHDQWLDFMLCWMIFDAYLTKISHCDKDRDKLNYFYQNKNDFKDCILQKWNSLKPLKLKGFSPIQDMRPNSSRVVYLKDENSLEHTFNFVYQIRCNLFHGAKDIKDTRDAELVRHGVKFLRACIDYWMKGDIG